MSENLCIHRMTMPSLHDLFFFFEVLWEGESESFVNLMPKSCHQRTAFLFVLAWCVCPVIEMSG